MLYGIPSLYAHKQHVQAAMYADIKRFPDRPCTQVCTPEKAWPPEALQARDHNNVIANVITCTPPQYVVSAPGKHVYVYVCK